MREIIKNAPQEDAPVLKQAAIQYLRNLISNGEIPTINDDLRNYIKNIEGECGLTGTLVDMEGLMSGYSTLNPHQKELLQSAYTLIKEYDIKMN